MRKPPLGPVLVPIAIALCFVTAPVYAALVTFTGSDPGAGSLATAPNSVAAATSFDTAAAALGTENVITFESSPLGSFTSLSPAPGVTLAGPTTSIRNTTSCTNPLCGYNTTAGGSQFVQIFGQSATFSFTSGINAFGSYLTGVQLAGETITFHDGSSQSIAIPNPGANGGTDFVGFTDVGSQIASVTINANNDIISMDDVRYVTLSVPSPLIGRGLPVLLAVGGLLFGAKLFGRGKKRGLQFG